jgi:hypothetical protein
MPCAPPAFVPVVAVSPTERRQPRRLDRHRHGCS